MYRRTKLKEKGYWIWLILKLFDIWVSLLPVHNWFDSHDYTLHCFPHTSQFLGMFFYPMINEFQEVPDLRFMFVTQSKYNGDYLLVLPHKSIDSLLHYLYRCPGKVHGHCLTHTHCYPHILNHLLYILLDIHLKLTQQFTSRL